MVLCVKTNTTGRGEEGEQPPSRNVFLCNSGFVVVNRKNDPAAGSPTATLLRLLLPLLKKYR